MADSGQTTAISYIPLARKWRPAQFSDIVGQSHIVRTLMNAIRGERIHQAYLFTGSRGIGKTSIARIFAKAIRCENARNADSWLRSCDECASCKEIASGNGIDVLEIDGASNNGVEAVREIRENAKYLPSTGSRKIYIIDEVHMLTTAAFNALLKTLEEPPAHVIFIFATTEPHKIPATILSRCQRFDFRRVTLVQIQARLAEITQAEGIEAEAGALALIARAAEGSMRDSQSILDQVIAFSGKKITMQSARESVGVVEGETLMGIIKGVFERKPLEALALVDQTYSRGHDLRTLTRSLIEFLHGSMLAKIGAQNSGGLELSEEEWKELRTVAELRPLEEIEMIFQVLHQGLEWIARSPQPKIVLDVLLVKCAMAESLMYLSDLQGAPPQPQNGSNVQAQSQVKQPAAPQGSAPVRSSAIPPASAPQPQSLAAPTPRIGSQNGPRNWEGLIEHVRQTRPLLASILEHGTCQSAPEQDGLLSLAYPSKDAYFKDQLQSRVYHEQLMNLSKDYFGKPVRITVEIKEVGGESLAEKREREQKQRADSIRSAAQNHPTILEAKSLFGGELGPIELTGGEDPDRG